MAFATHSDVSTRLGRDLTTAEESTATAVISLVEGLCADAVGRDTAWASALDPVPATLKVLAVDKAIAAISNPENLANDAKTLGAFRRSRGFREGATGTILLSEHEERAVRSAVYGRLSASSRPDSHLHTLLDLADDGELNNSLGS